MDKIWIKDGKFIELSEDQVKDLSNEQLAAYTADKTKANFDNIIEDAKKGLVSNGDYNQFKKDNSQAIKDASEGVKKELEEKHDKLMKALKEQGIEIAALKEGGEKEMQSLKSEISKELRKNLDVVKNFKKTDNKANGLVFTVKGTVLRADIVDDTEANRVAGIGQIQRRRPFIRELFTAAGVSPNNHGVIRYVDQETLTDNSAQIAEGAAFPSSDIDWKEYSLPIEKSGDSIKISREMMDDVDYVESEINNFLLRNVKLTIDNQLLLGNGTSPQLKGMASVATAFAAGDFANSIVDASYYDLIAVVATQIMTGTTYMPNAVLMNPVDATKMKLKKDGENNYVLPPFMVATPDGNVMIDGMVVVPNSGVTVNTMYVGDFTRGTVYSSEQFQIEMGYENDDFTKDLVTVKARERLALLIRNVDGGAFVNVSDIAAALTAITPA